MTTGMCVVVLLCCVLVGCSDSSESVTATTDDPTNAITTANDDLSIDELQRQFDFWLGSWNVSNNHLKGSEWEETGQAKATISSVAGGNGMVEQWDGIADGTHLRGFSIRAYDKTVKKWVIVLNWHGGSPSEIGIMEGGFKDGNGDFFPPNGNNVRFRFSDAKPKSCQWAQAVRQQDGSYQTNWIMKFTRIGAPGNMNAANTEPVMPQASVVTRHPQWRSFDTILGKWSGTAKRTKDGASESGQAKLTGTTMVEGLGMMAFIDIEWEGGEKVEHAWTIHHSAGRNAWMVLRLDSTDPEFYSSFGPFNGKQGEFIERDADGKQNVKFNLSVESDSMSIERFASEDDGQSWSSGLSLSLSRD